MAVPKKRTSKTKRKSRLANWTNKANIQAKRALSLAKSVTSEKSNSFIYSAEIADQNSVEET